MSHFQTGRIAAAALLAAGAVAAHAQTVQVEKICACWITSLSADGSAAAGTMSADYALMKWSRTAGVKRLGRNSMKALGTGGGTPRISRDGQVVAATILDSTGTFATEGRWTASGGWQQLDQPLPPDGGIMDLEDSDVFGMSGDGQVVTGLYWRPGYSGGSAHGSVWSAATGMVGMATAGGSSRIDGANMDGSVLSGWEEDPSTGSRMATVWVNGVKTGIDTVSWASEAETVNGDGTIIVGQAVDAASQRSEAAMWTWNGSGWDERILGIPAGATSSGQSYAISTSDDGSVVVGMYRDKFSTFASGGFVWTPADGMVDAAHWLEAQGIVVHPKKEQIQEVTSVSADGRVLSFLVQQLTPPYARFTWLVTRSDSAARK